MLALITVFVVLTVWWLSRPRRSPREAPGPRPWPLIGSLHLLAGHETPFQAFTELSKVYGNIFSIDLGATQCVVVTSFRLIKEVLILKGGDFGGRPDFIRFHKLFGGDRNNCKYLPPGSGARARVRGVSARRHHRDYFLPIHDIEVGTYDEGDGSRELELEIPGAADGFGRFSMSSCSFLSEETGSLFLRR